MRNAFVAVLLLFVSAAGAQAQSELPRNLLRATYIAANPVQAFVDKQSGELRGPGAALSAHLAERLGLKLEIKGVAGPQAVIDTVKKGEADIGLVAFDPVRAAEVDFSAPYAVGWNSYIVLAASPLKSVREIDRSEIVVGVAERDAADFFLTRELKAAKLKRNPGGNLDAAYKWLVDGEIQAYAANRQRLSEFVKRTPGARVLPDNFYGVEQAVAIAKGNAVLAKAVADAIGSARSGGVLASAIEKAGLVGVDVAPARP